MSASEAAPVPPRRASCPTCKAVFRGDFRRCPNDGAALVLGGPDPLVGTVLAERYQIEHILGDGGLGRVYRARHVRMSRRFAIKVPFGDVAYDRASRARLANEAEAASRLDHPNIIGVVDVGETAEGLFYLAMDLAVGRSLAEVLGDGPLAITDALEYLAQLSSGLAHAHERNLIHRDLKPDNVVVTITADGPPLLQIIDFGLALIAEDARSRLTAEGLVVGTPYYMAPEQTTDEPLDLRTDLFALGIILYEMLAGALPFDGGPTAVARQNLALELPTVLERSGRAIEPLLEQLIAWLTSKRKDDRPPDARVVGEVARLLLAGDRERASALLPAPRESASLPTVSERATPLPSMPPAFGERDIEPAADSAPDSLTAAPRLTAVPDRPPGNPLRRHALLACAGLGLGAVLALAVRATGDRDRARTFVVDAGPGPIALAPTVDATAAVALVPLDAPARAQLEPVDGGVTAPVDATPRATAPVGPVRTDPRPPPTVRPPPDVDAGVADRPPVATSKLSLRSLYAQIARDLDRAIARHGGDRTAELRRRFDRIRPYSDAQRTPAMSDEARLQLESLARDLARLGP